jgi:hypothetical protein
MDITQLKKYIKLKYFFEDYCKIDYTSHIRHKMRGKDSSGRPLKFTDAEEKAIRKGWRLFKESISLVLKK